MFSFASPVCLENGINYAVGDSVPSNDSCQNWWVYTASCQYLWQWHCLTVCDSDTVCLSVSDSVRLSISDTVCLSVCQWHCLSVCLSVTLSTLHMKKCRQYRCACVPLWRLVLASPMCMRSSASFIQVSRMWSACAVDRSSCRCHKCTALWAFLCLHFCSTCIAKFSIECTVSECGCGRGGWQ